MTYDSFGNLAASTGTLANSFRYTGREFDTKTGLYYYRARYYESTRGRFLTGSLPGAIRQPCRASHFLRSSLETG